MYISDLYPSCKYTIPILFAYDANCFSAGKDLKVTEKLYVSSVSYFSLFFSLTPVFQQPYVRVVKRDVFNYTIGSAKVNSSWKVAGKLSRSIGIIIQEKHFLNYRGLAALYCSFLYPFLS